MTFRGLWLSAALLLMGIYQANAQSTRYTREQVHAFVIAHLDHLQPVSFQNDLEYCGFIAINRSGRLIATPARQGKPSGCRLKNKPRHARVIATYHTHGGYNHLADTEVPSIFDLKHDLRQRVNGYIATPGGRVWFNDLSSRSSVLLCGPGCITTDFGFYECDETRPLTQYTIESLKWRKNNVTEPCK